MSEIELRELDKWIGLNVMGYKYINPDTMIGTTGLSAGTLPFFTTDPAANRELERKIAIMAGYVQIQAANDGTWVVTAANKFQATALTLELAIALLARKLWEHFEQWRKDL